jgi:hypothetical protein
MELAALRRAECRRPPNCTLTLRPLDRELKQLKLAHISQLANNGEYLNSGEIWQNKPGGSAIAPIPTLGPLLSIKLGSQCLWLAKNVGGSKPQRLGLAFTRVGIMFHVRPTTVILEELIKYSVCAGTEDVSHRA